MEENALSLEGKQLEERSTVLQERGRGELSSTTSGFLRVRWLPKQLLITSVNGAYLAVEDSTQASLKLSVTSALSHSVLTPVPYHPLCNFANPLVPGLDPNRSLCSAFSCANVVSFPSSQLTSCVYLLPPQPTSVVTVLAISLHHGYSRGASD